MNADLSPSLITFAFVKDEFDRRGDIYQGLMPLFAPVIKLRRGKDFDPLQFAKDVDEYYGLRMDPLVAMDLVKRLEDAGLLREKSRTKEYVEYINCDPDVLDPTEADAFTQSVLEDFHSFLRQRLAEHQITFSDDNIEAAIFKRLSTMEFLSVINKPEETASKSRTLKLGRTKINEVEETESDKMESRLDVLCAAYAIKQFNDAPDKFQRLCDIASGALASEVVLTMRAPPSSGLDLRKTTIFFDAPLVIDLLNLGSEEDHESAEQIRAQLIKLNANLAIFDHSVQELKSIIIGQLTDYDSNNKTGLMGSVGRRLKTDRLAVARARDIMKNLSERLFDLKLRVIDADKEDVDFVKYFIKEKVTELVAAIRPGRPIASRAVDGKSITSVVRHVLSRPAVANVLSSWQIFLTKNTGLVQDANRFLSRDRILQEGQALPFLSDRHMAGLLWVAVGGAGSEIPKRKLIANCVAAMRPRRDFITKIYSILSEIDPQESEQFEAIITDHRCSHYLMEHSLGDPNLVTPSNATVLLERIRAEIAANITTIKEAENQLALAEQEEQLHNQHREKEAGYVKRLDHASNRERQLSKDFEETKRELGRREAELNQVAYRLEAVERASKRRDEALLRRCAQKGERTARLVAGLIYLAIGLCVWLLGVILGELPGQKTTSWTSYLVWLFSTLIAVEVLGLLQFWFLPDVFFGNKVREFKQKRVERELRKLDETELLDRYYIDLKTLGVLERPPILQTAGPGR
jgi:hypothetical protein